MSRRNEQQLSSQAAQLEGPGDNVGEEEVEHPLLRIMADRDFTSLVGKITKLKGASNYRTWVKDMEMYLLRNHCWSIVTTPLPPPPDCTEE